MDSELGKFSKFTVDLPISKDSHSDFGAISKRLDNAHVLYITGNNDRLDLTIFDNFDVPVKKFQCVHELESWLASARGDSRDGQSKFYFVLANEDLHQQDVFERITSFGSTALISFGPMHKAPNSHCHFKCPSHIIPFVMMESFASCMDNVRKSKSDPQKPTTGNDVCLGDIRVLIAEDNVINQKVLRHMLQRLGINNVDVANNGKEAVDMSSAQEYELIFMDMQVCSVPTPH